MLQGKMHVGIAMPGLAWSALRAGVVCVFLQGARRDESTWLEPIIHRARRAL